MDAIKQKITGGAYDKPAKTKDGAMTTQDSDDAYTIEGTSADPNVGNADSTYLGDKAQQLKDKASEKASEKKGQADDEGVTQKASEKASQAKEKADDKGVTQKAKETADEHGVGDKARQAEQKTNETTG